MSIPWLLAAFRSGLAASHYPRLTDSCASGGGGTSVSAVFSPFSLMLIGLACLALHLAGVGTGWRLRR